MKSLKESASNSLKMISESIDASIITKVFDDTMSDIFHIDAKDWKRILKKPQLITNWSHKWEEYKNPQKVEKTMIEIATFLGKYFTVVEKEVEDFMEEWYEMEDDDKLPDNYDLCFYYCSSTWVEDGFFFVPKKNVTFTSSAKQQARAIFDELTEIEENGSDYVEDLQDLY